MAGRDNRPVAAELDREDEGNPEQLPQLTIDAEVEARQLHETFAVPVSGVPLFQGATANLNLWTEAKVDTKNPTGGRC